nr:hypothetical protein MACL_00000391 [Theileria orientalis]
MGSKSYRSRSRDRKNRKYEYSSTHGRHRSIEKKYTERERVSYHRDRSRDRKYRGHSPSYSRERSYERRRDRRSHDRHSGKRDGREVRRSESHREERRRENSSRHKHRRYKKHGRSPSRSTRKRHGRSRSVSLGRSDGRRTPSEPSEKLTVPVPPEGTGSGATASGTSRDGTRPDKGSESEATKTTLKGDRTLTVMRDGKIISSTVQTTVRKEESSSTATISETTIISGVKLESEAIARSGGIGFTTKTKVEGESTKEAAMQEGSSKEKGEKDAPDGTWKGFPPPKYYKKLTKYYDAVPKFGALAPNMYFPLDGAKLRRYKAYKSYNDKLRRYDELKFYKRQLMNLVRSDFDYLKMKLEVSLNLN